MSEIDTTYQEEQVRLEQLSESSLYSCGVMETAIAYAYKIISRDIRGNILELGPAEGVMTKFIHDAGHGRITAVEGSELFCKHLKRQFPRITVINSLFEAYEPAERFDTIILGHVLEHVINPAGLLKKIRDWLAPGGIIYAYVPNAFSIHRQAAVIMGILDNEHTLNEMDKHHGHRQVFDPETFRKLFIESGYSINQFGGFWMKPVSNSQIEANWTPDMISAFMQLGERYPEQAGIIYVVSSNQV